MSMRAKRLHWRDILCALGLAHALRRGRGGKEKLWAACAERNVTALGILGDWKTLALLEGEW